MIKLYVDADACPVKAEAEKVATRHKISMYIVSNGGIRPSQNPCVQTVVVDQSADAADKWIADQCDRHDIVVTSDIPLAAKVIEKGAIVVKPNGELISDKNIGSILATRDLMADLRASDPFFVSKGRSFSKNDRSRFLDALDRVINMCRAKIS
jgi:uncharacterized protein YaiI (UPF0178 family)